MDDQQEILMQCDKCDRIFKHKGHYTRHIENKLNPCDFKCVGCNTKFPNRKSFYRHKNLCEDYQGISKIINNNNVVGSVDNSTNIGSQQNNQNIVLLNPFNADHYCMTKENIIGPARNVVVGFLLKEKYAAAYEFLFKSVHGNETLPQHHNIYLPHIDKNYIAVFKGKDFKLEDVNVEIPALFERLKYEMKWLVKTCSYLTKDEKSQLQWDVEANSMCIDEKTDLNIRRMLRNNKTVVMDTLKNNIVKPNVEMINKLLLYSTEKYQKLDYIPRKHKIDSWLDIGYGEINKDHIVRLP